MSCVQLIICVHDCDMTASGALHQVGAVLEVEEGEGPRQKPQHVYKPVPVQGVLWSLGALEARGLRQMPNIFEE